MRRAITFIAGVTFALVLVATCGTRQDSMLSDMGHAIGDLLGLDLGGAKDAAAAAPLASACDKTWKFLNAGNGQETAYAEFSVPGYDPTMPEHVTVWVCDPTYYDASGTPTTLEAFQIDATASPCPASTTCDPVPAGKCSESWGHTAGPGVIRVRCGYRAITGGVEKNGITYAKAYVKVGP